MILGTFYKQPVDILDFDIDFSPFFTDGDTLASTGNPAIPSPLDVTVSPEGLTLGYTFVIGNGTKIKQWVSGGTDGVRYKISVTATSNAGRVKQVEFVVRVKED